MSTYHRIPKSQQISGLLQSADVKFRSDPQAIAIRNTSVDFPPLTSITYGSLSNPVIFNKGSNYSIDTTLEFPDPDQISGEKPTYSLFFGLSSDSLSIANGGTGHIVGDQYLIYSNTSIIPATVTVDSVDENGAIVTFRTIDNGYGFDNSNISSSFYHSHADIVLSYRENYSAATFDLVPNKFCISKIEMLTFGSGYQVLEFGSFIKKTFFINSNDTSGSGFLAYSQVGAGYQKNNQHFIKKLYSARHTLSTHINNQQNFYTDVDIILPVISTESLLTSQNFEILVSPPPSPPPEPPECWNHYDSDAIDPSTNEATKATLYGKPHAPLSTAGNSPAEIALAKSALARIADFAWKLRESELEGASWRLREIEGGVRKTRNDWRRLVRQYSLLTDAAKRAAMRQEIRKLGQVLIESAQNYKQQKIQEFIAANIDIDFNLLMKRQNLDLAIDTMTEVVDGSIDKLNRRGNPFTNITPGYMKSIAELFGEILYQGDKAQTSAANAAKAEAEILKRAKEILGKTGAKKLAQPKCPRQIINPDVLPNPAPRPRSKPKVSNSGKIPTLVTGIGAIASLAGLLAYFLNKEINDKKNKKPEFTEQIITREFADRTEVITRLIDPNTGKIVSDRVEIQRKTKQNKAPKNRQRNDLGVIVDGGGYALDILLSVPWSAPEIFVNGVIDPPSLNSPGVSFEQYVDESRDIALDYLAGRIPEDVMQILLDHDQAYYDDNMNGGYALKAALLDLLNIPYYDISGDTLDLNDISGATEETKEKFNDAYLQDALINSILENAELEEQSDSQDLIDYLKEDNSNACSLCDEDLQLLLDAYDQFIAPIGITVPGTTNDTNSYGPEVNP